MTKSNPFLQSISIKGYKSLDKLDVKFQPQTTLDWVNITAIGSRMAVGKTSFLEGCAHAVVALKFGCDFDKAVKKPVIEANFSGKRDIKFTLGLDSYSYLTDGYFIEGLLYFAAHRQGTLSLCIDRPYELSVYNTLLKEFADCTTKDGVVLKLNKRRTQLRFNDLSAGQREIISTLYTIWSFTKDTPSVVLIDEPELHLNAETQRQYVSWLAKLAPKNQYIVATNSEHIYDSVSREKQIMLRRT